VDANGGVGAKREKKLTCYTPEQLAPALVHVARENIKMPAKIIKPILRTLVSNELSSSFITRTRAIVTCLVKGNPEILLHQFPAYIAALRDNGHDADCLVVTAETLKKDMLSWAKESHKAKEKGLDKEARTIFKEEETKELIQSLIDDSADYLIGFEISPASSRALWAKDVTIPVFNVDFAHMFKTGLHGSCLLFSLVLNTLHILRFDSHRWCRWRSCM